MQSLGNTGTSGALAFAGGGSHRATVNLEKIMLQLAVPQRAALSQGVPDLTGSLPILPRQRQVEPQGGAIRSLVQVDEMLAEAAQQAGLSRAFVTCERDQAGWERKQFGGRQHVRTIARLAPGDSAPAAVAVRCPSFREKVQA